MLKTAIASCFLLLASVPLSLFPTTDFTSSPGEDTDEHIIQYVENGEIVTEGMIQTSTAPTMAGSLGELINPFYLTRGCKTRYPYPAGGVWKYGFCDGYVQSKYLNSVIHASTVQLSLDGGATWRTNTSGWTWGGEWSVARLKATQAAKHDDRYYWKTKGK